MSDKSECNCLKVMKRHDLMLNRIIIVGALYVFYFF